ncbi:hypothetical protein XO12_09580 [Marinitoga sp. 1154]|uniref:hypothetical protein n=1 Tax=Marinitoga sp. 1154 TaxID=1643335 RepID=UPI001586BBE4|nr:hypothetical protein [Marinitoga sp. 1154]NUV00327.1 hypothetical protein [Marinitoga sp. 1154]
MKKILFFLIIIFSIISFGYISIDFNFIFSFGSTGTSYSQYVKLHYIDDSMISTVTFHLKRYPQEIIINDEKYNVFSSSQKFITGSGILKVKYKDKTYEFLLNNEELNISLDKEIYPVIKIESYTKEVSPNDDWYNDRLKILLYSNTYATIKLDKYKKSIYPGKNEIYFPINYEDGNYKIKILIFNERGSYEQDITIKVNRQKRTLTKYIVLGIFGLFLGMITYISIK